MSSSMLSEKNIWNSSFGVGGSDVVGPTLDVNGWIWTGCMVLDHREGTSYVGAK